jgi:PAS domain S-box-containing protein
MSDFDDVLLDDGVGLWRWSERTGSLDWSPGMFDLHGRDPLAGAPTLTDWLAQLTASEGEQELLAILRDADEGSVTHATFLIVRADGVERHASCTVRVRCGTAGEREVAGAMRDLGAKPPLSVEGALKASLAHVERVRTAESLRTQTQELEAAQALANVGTWVFDTETGSMRWSEEMFRIHGLSPETFVPTVAAAASVIMPEDREGVERANKSLRTKPRVGPYNYRVRLPTGEVRHLVGAARMIRNSDRVGMRILGTALDVTSRVELEAMLLHAQKLEGLGRLAGGVAHDFNNALTAILANADAALMANPNGVEEELREITQAALHASEVTRQLLAFARRDTARAQRISPNDVLGTLSRTLGRLVGEDVEVEIRYAAQPATVLADPGRLEQVLLNLVVNARDAMPKGGLLTITTSVVDLDAAYVARQVGAAQGRHVRLEVRDTGTGMTEDTKRRLFEPFFTTKPAGVGTGLGLATCYGVVRQAGGHLTVETQPGAGTTFCVYLPVASEEAIALSAAPRARARQGGSETILVAEDDLGVRRVLLRTLRALGYSVLEAVDGAEAVERARSHEGTIHLLLSDVIMPRLRGPDAARAIRELRPAIRVLFITGYAGEHDSTLWNEGPVLGKPFTPDALAARIREVLDADLFLSEALLSEGVLINDAANDDAPPTE